MRYPSFSARLLWRAPDLGGGFGRWGLLPEPLLPQIGAPVDPLAAFGGRGNFPHIARPGDLMDPMAGLGARNGFPYAPILRPGELLTARGMAERAAGRRLSDDSHGHRRTQALGASTYVDNGTPLQVIDYGRQSSRRQTQFDRQPIPVNPDGTMSVWPMGISQHVTSSELQLGIGSHTSDAELVRLFKRWRNTDEGRGARQFAFRLGPTGGGVSFGDTSSIEDPYDWAVVNTDGSVKRVRGNYYTSSGAAQHRRQGLMTQPKMGDQAQALEYARRLETICLVSDDSPRAPSRSRPTAVAAPYALGGVPDIVESVPHAGIPYPAFASPEQTPVANLGTGSVEALVREAAIDGEITAEEAENLIRAFGIEKNGITRETREKWYALHEDYRINLQNALGVKADGKIAKNGGGETIGKLREIARGQA